MKTLNIFLTVVALAVVGIFAFWFLGQPKTQVAVSPTPTVSVSPSSTPAGQYDQSVSDGAVKVLYSSAQFGLATTPAQIQVKAYIPPCDPAFKYCLYYNGTVYAGTNFESAGFRIQNRVDLNNQTLCMNSQPTGYTGLIPVKFSGTNYNTSVFSPLGDAGAGHYANGAEYRLWTGASCYEFETRIGETQFANYPVGTIKEFSTVDRTNVSASLRGMLDNVTLSDGTKVSFPVAK